MSKAVMREQSDHDESYIQTQLQTNEVSLQQQNFTGEETQQALELSSSSIDQQRDGNSLTQIIENFLSPLEWQRLAEGQEEVISQSEKMTEQSEMWIAEYIKQMEEEYLRILTPVFEALGGTVGQGNQARCGIWALSHFNTTDYPQLAQNSTVTVRIGNKDYTSKPYKQWLVGRVTMIPLQKGPTTNMQVDILGISKLDCSTIGQPYMFGKVGSQTQKIKLCLDNKRIKFKFVKNSKDLFNSVMRGAPVMTIHRGRPVICCLKDYPQINAQFNPSQKFTFWTLKDNLNKEDMQKMIYLKSEIAKMKEQIDKLQKELDNLSYRYSVLSSTIFSGYDPQQEFPSSVILERMNKDDQRQFKELINLNINYLQKEKVFGDKLQKFCKVNHRINAPNIKDLLQYLVQQAKFKENYNNLSALKKFTLLDRVNQEVKNNFLYFFVRRAFYNMRYVASWPNKRHILNYNFFLKEQTDQKFEFSYETVMCECGCKENGRDSHGQGMKKKALDKPLTFIIAMLDAVIQFEEHFLIHNDITFRNFIFYDGDFLLGDFDMSCFVKDSNKIEPSKEIERHMNELNLSLIDRIKLINKPLKQKKQQIDIFFMHTENQLDMNERSDETLNRLEQTMSKIHQKQITKIVEELFSHGNNSSQNKNTINEIILRFDSAQIGALQAYRKIMSWAQQKRQKESLESFIEN